MRGNRASLSGPGTRKLRDLQTRSARQGPACRYGSDPDLRLAEYGLGQLHNVLSATKVK